MKFATPDCAWYGDSFEQKLRTAQAFGFDAMEIGGDVLVRRFEEIRTASRETGFPVSSVCGGYRGWIGDLDEEGRRTAIQDISEILRRTGDIGAVGVVVPAAFGMFSKKLPPFQPPRSAAQDLEVLLDSLQRLDQVAGEAGCFVLLEPLNRYEDHMLNRLSDAVSVIEQGAFRHVKVTADLFHMNIEEADLAASIRQAGTHIGHVHLADSNRLQPGLGHTDFASAFAALKEVGFDGFAALECEVRGEPQQAFREVVTFLRNQAGE
ncbi:MAG: sugar phosphate isomerase/epimerase [Alicyclobacillus sp.]|nr:sugar phosphate isomerase/epimerase [Alicyclobacillus sp.]